MAETKVSKKTKSDKDTEIKVKPTAADCAGKPTKRGKKEIEINDVKVVDETPEKETPIEVEIDCRSNQSAVVGGYIRRKRSI